MTGLLDMYFPAEDPMNPANLLPQGLLGPSVLSRMQQADAAQRGRWQAGERGPTPLTEDNMWLADDVAGGLLGAIGVIGKIKPVGAAAGLRPADPIRISTRVPSLKSSVEDPLLSDLIIDTSAMRANPTAYEHNAGLLSEYVNAPNNLRGASADDVVAGMQKEVEDNLLWLHDAVPPENRAATKQWYDGARRITDDWATQFDVPDFGVAGALAALSPQKDWFQNVSLAERTLDVVKNMRDFRPDAAMRSKSAEIFGQPQYADLLGEVLSGSLDDMPTPLHKAMWVRLYDQAHNPRSYRQVTPTGEFIGDPSGNVAWGSLAEIAKAVEVIESPTREAASRLMGNKHKVRNFFNNIIAPNADAGDVTIDTHAVAAGLLRPLSGSSPEVAHNFGNSLAKNLQPEGWRAAKSAAVSGAEGTYGVLADAYRSAAAKRDILPREMQSITWEAVRGLFPAKWKNAKNRDLVDTVWKEYQSGKINAQNARQRVAEIAGGIEEPPWLRSPAGLSADTARTSYEGELPKLRVSRGGSR